MPPPNTTLPRYGPLGGLINNFQISHLEGLAPPITIVRIIMVILHPRPHILQPLDRRRLLLLLPHKPQPLEQRRRRRLDIHIIARPHKVKQPQPVPTQLIRRRTNHPMRRRFEVRRRPKIKRVTHVANDATVHRWDVAPLAPVGVGVGGGGGCLDLQTGYVLRPEERQGTEIGVGACPLVVDLGVLVGGSWVVEHVAEMVVAGVFVAMPFGEEVLGELEDDGEEDKDLFGYG